MNKKVISIIAIIAIVAILGVVLVACNAESVSKKLGKKDYNVVTLDEKSEGLGATIYKAVKGADGFKEGVFATKEGDLVVAIWFEKADQAKECESDLNGMATILKVTGVNTIERSGKIVFVGSEQGVKDAK